MTKEKFIGWTIGLVIGALLAYWLLPDLLNHYIDWGPRVWE